MPRAWLVTVTAASTGGHQPGIQSGIWIRYAVCDSCCMCWIVGLSGTNYFSCCRCLCYSAVWRLPSPCCWTDILSIYSGSYISLLLYMRFSFQISASFSVLLLKQNQGCCMFQFFKFIFMPISLMFSFVCAFS